MAGGTHIWAGKLDDGKTAPEPKLDAASQLAPLLLAIGLIAIGLLAMWSSMVAAMLTAKSNTPVSPVYPTNAVSNSAERYQVSTSGEPAIGPEDAGVTVVEFGDFQCPFCKRFFADVEQPLLQKYTGKIRFVFRDFPMPEMHPYSEVIAEAAHCAEDQHKFWEYHDLLFQRQPVLDKTALTTYARLLNLDITTFEQCLTSGKHKQHVQTNFGDGLALGITGTPTFFINGQKLVGAQPLSALSAYIDADLGLLSH
jgi:protein-disulfide isomerase